MSQFGPVLPVFLVLVAASFSGSWTFAARSPSAQLTVSPATGTLVSESASAATPSPTPAAASALTATATIVIATPAARYTVMCSSEDDQARQAYNDGNALELLGKLEQAKAAYRNAIQLDAGYCDAMDHLARLLRQEGKLEEAVILYKRSISISPKNIVARANLALVYQLQGNTEDAMAEYQRLVDIAPDDPEGHFGLGSVSLDKRQPEQALIYFEKAETLYAARSSPLISDARYYLGITHFILRQFAKAKDYFELISTEMGDNAYFNFYLGLCYLSPEVGDLERARKYLRRAEELGIKTPVEVQKLLASETAVPIATQTPTPPPATPAVVLPLPRGQPVSSWNDIPVMPQAISGSEDRSGYSYTVKATVAQVQEFYDEEMIKAGWRPFTTSAGRTDSKVVMYQKGGKTSGVFIVEQGEIILVVLVSE